MLCKHGGHTPEGKKNSIEFKPFLIIRKKEIILHQFNELVFSFKSLKIQLHNVRENSYNIPEIHLKIFNLFKHLVWFVWFYGISTFVGYLTPNPFLCK